MKSIALIGIGAGNPEQITVEAIKALNRTDVFFLLDKGPAKAELLDARLALCERYIERPGYRVVRIADPQRARQPSDYVHSVEAWHRQRARLWARLIDAELKENERGAFLIWGDPSLYDGTLRIVERMKAAGLVFDYQVIPGISSVQALAARHRIALTAIAGSLQITTGRRLARMPAADIDNLVVMLDAHAGLSELEQQDLYIYWGAYLGTADELLIHGPLAQARPRIIAAREQARQRKGWIMDTYLLRRCPAPPS